MFLQEASQNPECRGLDLQAWLIKPLQRLCKYPLLMRVSRIHFLTFV